MPKPGRAPLSGLENKVMRVVWQQGQATAELVRGALAESDELNDSTVRTILRRLEQKGYLRHYVDGRTYVYQPTVARHNAAADAVRGIIQRLCNGSVEELLMGMVDRELISPEALQRLAQRVAENRKPVADKKRPKKG
jgi:BlaI family transcriptional regulator, penicillinase repressor